MTVETSRRTMAETKYIPAGSALHQAFHAFSQAALRITAEMNGAYHTPEELRRLMSELTSGEIDDGFGIFPPFHCLDLVPPNSSHLTRTCITSAVRHR